MQLFLIYDGGQIIFKTNYYDLMMSFYYTFVCVNNYSLILAHTNNNTSKTSGEVNNCKY